MSENGFFKITDPKTDQVGGFPINANWWSRSFEYPWAFQFAGKDQTVADMGCGWTPRPFKDALAATCEKVYAVDGNKNILDFKAQPRLTYVVADFTEPVEAIPDESLDRLFCISVLEDIGGKVAKALYQFGRLIKQGGLCVLTFDVQYDMDKPLGQYPGVKLESFQQAVDLSGLKLREQIETDKSDAVYNPDFNLACYHCVLVKL
jgi:ubiquinone/menaquinone biosynthesis C-methylase UbiE